MLRLFLLLFAMLMGALRHLHAQEAEKTLTSVPLVLKLDAVEAGLYPHPVKLRGVVLGISVQQDAFVIHDGTSSIGVDIATELCPEAGDSVAIEGKTITQTLAGHRHPRVQADKITVTGRAELPKPQALSLATLNSFTHYDQWVSVEGYVWMWRYKASYLTLRLAGRDGWTTANIRLDNASQTPLLLHGARVRLTGLNVGDHTPFNGLFVPGLEHVEVLSAGTRDPFEAPLVPIADVAQRKVEPGKRVRVQGAFLSFSEDRVVCMQADGHGLANTIAPPWSRIGKDVSFYQEVGLLPELKLGDQIEMVGSVVDSDFENPAIPFALSWCQVRVIGKAEPPKPHAISLQALLNMKDYDEWVSTEGVVTGWALHGGMIHLSLLDANSSTLMTVRDAESLRFPRDLHGAQVRLIGMTRSRVQGTGFRQYIPNPTHLEVVKPGTVDSFAVQAYPMAEVAAHQVPPAQRIHVRGVLIGRTSEDTLYVRDGPTAICVELQRGWNRPANSTGMYFADCGPRPEMKIGDELEIVGSQQQGTADIKIASFDLLSCHVRVVGRQPLLRPVATTLANVAAGNYTNDLVELRGRLLTLQQVPMDYGQWRTTMLIENDDVKLPVTFQGAGRAVFDNLEIDDEVTLRGLVDRETPHDPRQLRLTSAGDVRSLGLSPVVLARRLWIWGGSGAAATLLLGIWVTTLRRSLARQRVADIAVRDLNSTLERRVTERTSELEQAQIELHRALAHERELGELKSRFVTTVSHEFRTPLGIIMSAVELMRHYEERLPKEQRRELCDDIHSATRLMAGLMEQVLVLGRVEADKLGYRPAPIDIDILAGKLTDESLSATNHRCPIHWRPEGSLEDAQADEALLRHIFSNLITNAVKYSPEGRAVELTARREGTDAVFQVIDHGIGIPVEDQPRLFEAFHRCSNVGETPGTGLGLVIVKRCVELHSGTMKIDSEVGRGTSFTVRLPLFKDDDE